MFNRFIKLSFVLLPITIFYSGCSSTEESEDLANEDNLVENNTKSESINSAEGEDAAAMNDFDSGEAVNNAADNEFADTGSANSLNLGNQSATQNTAALGANTAPPANLAANATATPTNAAPLPDNLAMTNAATGNSTTMPAALNVGTEPAAAETAPAEATPALPTSGGLVKYLTSAAPLSAQPGGAPTGMLEQGDHPVVWDEGQFARTSSGQYIPASNLSDRGVGRVRKDVSWQSGQ